MSEAILKTKLTGDSAEFKKSLKEGFEAAREFGAEVGDSIKETLLQVSALVLGFETIKEGIEKTFEGVKGVFELSKDLRNLSNQTGASIHDLVELRAEFDLSGVASDNVGNVLNKMQRSIEEASDKGGKMAEIFGRINLNVRNLQQLDPAQQFEAIRRAVSSIEDPARRAQVAMDLFGRGGSGGSILAIFGNSKIAEEAADVISAQADILARNAETFQEVSIAMETSSINIKGFFVGMAEPISRVLLPVLEQLNSIDLLKWGKQIGNGIAEAVRVLYNAFEEGKLGELVSLSLRVGFEEAIGWLIGALPAVGNAIYDIFDSGLASHMSSIFDGVALQFGAALLNAFEAPITFLQGGVAFAMGKLNEANDHRKLNDAEYQVTRQSQVLSNTVKYDEKGNPSIIPGMEDVRKVAMERLMKANSDVQVLYKTVDEDHKANSLPFSDFMEDYKKNNKASFYGATSTDMTDRGKSMIEEAMKEVPGIISSLTAKIAQDLKNITPSGLAQTAADKKELETLLAKLNKPIPGEGKENELKPGFAGGGQDFGFGQLQGISKDQAGNWSYFSSSGQGAISLGDQGSAGRAGRIEASPDGKSPNELLSDMDKHLKNIDTAVSNLTAPA